MKKASIPESTKFPRVLHVHAMHDGEKVTLLTLHLDDGRVFQVPAALVASVALASAGAEAG